LGCRCDGPKPTEVAPRLPHPLFGRREPLDERGDLWEKIKLEVPHRGALHGQPVRTGVPLSKRILTRERITKGGKIYKGNDGKELLHLETRRPFFLQGESGKVRRGRSQEQDLTGPTS